MKRRIPASVGLLMGSLLGIAAICLLFVLIAVLLMEAWIAELSFSLLVGWGFHLFRQGSAIKPAWDTIAISLGSLALATAGFHRVVGWWCRTRGVRPWTRGQSISVIGLILLGAAAAICLSGVVHQGLWLGVEPMVKNPADRKLVARLNEGRLLAKALADHTARHGRYPASLMDLLDPAIQLHHESGNPAGRFILLVPGASPTSEIRPIAISSTIGSSDRIVIVYSDGTITSTAPEQLDQTLRDARR